ncbi:MAG TPA: preprotein translocase subunit SecG [Lysobacter sp.]|nr:preprotein translocase subunit SecG [Lysobacter sp.]
MLFLNIIYVLLAIGMIALILMQRGAGAQAGSGFGGGASGTVFGARGSANFLSKTTKWLAVAFFVLSLLISWNITRGARTSTEVEGGSLMSQQIPTAPATTVPAVPSNGAIPAAPSAPSVVPSTPDTAPTSAPAPTVPTDASNTSNSPAEAG